MGIYVNPGNQAFARICKGSYVDKTGLIELVNAQMDGFQNLICVSRPRRFGKSFAAKMLTAYYDCSCDSHALFDDKIIARTAGYEEHLNQYNVICLDITGFISTAKRKGIPLRDVPERIDRAVYQELCELDPLWKPEGDLETSLIRIAESPGGKSFVFVIDEWDAMIREAKEDEFAQEAFLNLLRGWFKNMNFTPKAVAAAYMTGILPIKKDGSQSAISDFMEYSVLTPGKYAPFVGFTEKEVKQICEENDMPFDQAKAWYDGYSFSTIRSIYNPYSVMSAMEWRRYQSYWQKTSVSEALETYVRMDQDGLQDVIARFIAGEAVEIDTDGFRNDFQTFNSKDDVLTLLIHLGYLAFDPTSKTARIPNEELRIEFQKLLKNPQSPELLRLLRVSQKLFEDTLAGKEEEVAAGISAVHDSTYGPLFYNDEQALRYVIRFAYLSCIDQYARVEELPTGHGIADVVYLPRRGSPLPAMAVELKWDRSEEEAIAQIKERNYPAILKDYGGEIVLVGINYDSKNKLHSCRIEKM